MNGLSLLESLGVSVLEGGETLDVGEVKSTSSSCFHFRLLWRRFSLLVLLTTLLLFNFFALSAGESCSDVVVGEGGELADQASGSKPGWKNAGFVGKESREATISCEAMMS